MASIWEALPFASFVHDHKSRSVDNAIDVIKGVDKSGSVDFIASMWAC